MAMGTRKNRERQEDLWVVSSEVAGTPAHAFYGSAQEFVKTVILRGFVDVLKNEVFGVGGGHAFGFQ